MVKISFLVEQCFQNGALSSGNGVKKRQSFVPHKIITADFTLITMPPEIFRNHASENLLMLAQTALQLRQGNRRKSFLKVEIIFLLTNNIKEHFSEICTNKEICDKFSSVLEQLAKKYGKDPQKWDGNVAEYICEAEMNNKEYKTKSDMIYHKVRDSIFKGEYSPGERLLIASVAEQYGISEIPVREAFRTLTQEGVLTSKPNNGFYISQISLKEVMDIFAVRINLEGKAIRDAVMHFSPDDLIAIEDLWKESKLYTEDDLLKKIERLEIENDFLRSVSLAYGLNPEKLK